MHNLRLIRQRFPQQGARIIAILGLISLAGLAGGLLVAAL